mmetsp:Transcript_23116/g.32299  ORF Transcript_23116/g.32299 Transcript_23116/m.32299 type:complete len:247 (-) Transcript_23116:208-948(-)|eukprot:CAMPEP_0185279240 /NCGR_PEP_ID=MMETSP1359-20130426/63032_1 /TAXON_ID=552665 /ORGANISM="Bigelowiella longifila, Strain CCMP242" /LENGTH=246 /DNA_ID=CAMNT_0027874061 /DNA_START=286 /DNA_END=1026 /DNA_ORIENTATION=-
MAFSLHNEQSWQDFYGAWTMESSGFREWYLDLDDVCGELQKHLDTFKAKKHSNRILHSGTGTSELPFRLHKAGYTSQVGIDFSGDCVKSLQSALGNSELKGMEFKKMDVRRMDFEKESFHAVVDKGTLDCVMLTEKGKESAHQYLKEISRILVKGGEAAIFSLYGPSEREVCVKCHQFEGVELSCKHYDMPEAFETPNEGPSHLYVFRKGQTEGMTPSDDVKEKKDNDEVGRGIKKSVELQEKAKD